METSITRRFPRPMGMTALAVEYQKQPTQDAFDNLNRYLINQWFMNNGNICGVPYDINSLIIIFGINRDMLDEYMRDNIIGSKIWTQDNGEDILQGLMSMQVAWAMEDRMDAAQQVSILRNAQGNKYVPFVSAELNKSLKLKQESSTSLQTLVRGLFGGSSTNIFNIQNNQQNTQVNTISIEEARELIAETQKNIPKAEEAKLLEAKYDISSLPEVVAMNQSGVDTSKEGLNLNKIELNSITDDYKGAIEVSSQEHHELRREIEQNIDPDEIDPEILQYEEEDTSNEEYGNIGYQFLNH